MSGRTSMCGVLVGIMALCLPFAATAAEAVDEQRRPAKHETHQQDLGKQILHQLPGGPLAVFVAGFVKRCLALQADVDLSDEQRRRICSTLMDHRQAMAEQVKELWLKRNALRDKVLAKESNEAAIRAAADEFGREIGDAAVLAAKIKGHLAPIMTEQQRKRIRQFIDDNDKAEEQFYHHSIERLERRSAAKTGQ